MNQTYDALPSSYRVGDVSFTLLAATFKNLKKETFDLTKDLPSAGLVSDDGQITNGGLLLCDQGVLRQSRIFCTRWKGDRKVDDKEFQGASLITLLQNAEGALIGNIDQFIGKVNEILFVVYTERVRIEESGTKTDVTRLISARMATEFERGLYYGKNE